MIPTNTQAPADVEVAELVRWLRENADSAANAGHHEPAEMLNFASDLLERPAKTPIEELSDDDLIVAATEAGLCYPQCWDFSSQPERLEHLRAFARSIIARCGNHFPNVTKMVGPASAGWVLMPPSLASESTVEEVAELVTALRQVSDGANACGDDGTSWITARAANLLEQHLTPVPVYERDLDSILRPSGGYELREGAALTEGAQLIDGEWWAPVFGCDSVECTLDRIRQRLDPFQQNGKLKNYQAFAPSPVPISKRLPGPEDCDAEGRCWWEFEGSDEFGPSWTLMKMHGIPSDMTRWLPVCVNALPIPSGEVQP